MVINSRRLVWHVACIMEIRNTYKVSVGKSEELGELNVSRRIGLSVITSRFFLKDNNRGNTRIT
jgi:hypothetical protein